MRFDQFPKSYRFSQFGIAAAFVITTVLGAQARLMAPPLSWLVWGLIGTVVVACLAVSNYVVIRYPYISLVEPEDGDYFSFHYQSTGSVMRRVLSFIACLATVIAIVSISLVGFDNVRKVCAVIYLGIMAPFLFFFSIFYEPIKHSTISTMIRATLGLGVVLFPFFMFSVLIGSRRNKLLLDDNPNLISE